MNPMNPFTYLNVATSTLTEAAPAVPGHEPQILAFCSCGWESPVYATGAAAEIKWQRHVEGHRP